MYSILGSTSDDAYVITSSPLDWTLSLFDDCFYSFSDYDTSVQLLADVHRDYPYLAQRTVQMILGYFGCYRAC